MGIIQRDGKFYKVTTYEEEIDPAYEAQKLQGWKDAIAKDQQDVAEYKAKLAEIDALDLSDEYKEKLKLAVPFYSGSGIKPEQIAEVEATLAAVAVAAPLEIKP